MSDIDSIRLDADTEAWQEWEELQTIINNEWPSQED